MKKAMFTAIAAVAMLAMVACNNNQSAEPAEDTTCVAVEQCEHKCAHEGDTAMCCKAEAVAEECEHQCEKACEQKCDKAEGKECCKKAEGEKCCKAEGKECHKECKKDAAK